MYLNQKWLMQLLESFGGFDGVVFARVGCSLISVGTHTVDSGWDDVTVDNPVTVLISNVCHEVSVSEGILPFVSSGDAVSIVIDLLHVAELLLHVLNCHGRHAGHAYEQEHHQLGVHVDVLLMLLLCV